MFLHAVVGEGVDVIVRMKDSYGAKLLGETTAVIAEKSVTWIPSSRQADGNTVSRKGRIIRYVLQIKGFRSNEFYFFTTDTNRIAEEIAALYRKRVQVEVFSRGIKQILKMAFIRSRKEAPIEKEILIAFLTFNLLRAIMGDTASALELPVTGSASPPQFHLFVPMRPCSQTHQRLMNITAS